jgi:uncharacterized protein (DUF433 family)
MESTALSIFARSPEQEAPKVIVIDPRISFGRAVLAGTNIPTEMLAERWAAGETLDDLAHDYDYNNKVDIEKAIQYELQAARAAQAA